MRYTTIEERARRAEQQTENKALDRLIADIEMVLNEYTPLERAIVERDLKATGEAAQQHDNGDPGDPEKFDEFTGPWN